MLPRSLDAGSDAASGEMAIQTPRTSRPRGCNVVVFLDRPLSPSLRREYNTAWDPPPLFRPCPSGHTAVLPSGRIQSEHARVLVPSVSAGVPDALRTDLPAPHSAPDPRVSRVLLVAVRVIGSDIRWAWAFWFDPCTNMTVMTHWHFARQVKVWAATHRSTRSARLGGGGVHEAYCRLDPECLGRHVPPHGETDLVAKTKGSSLRSFICSVRPDTSDCTFHPQGDDDQRVNPTG